MTGLDTNVLVRLLTADNREQHQLASAYVRAHCTTETPGFINRVVLVELVWVLESAYEYARDEIATAVEGVLRTSELTIENASSAWKAVAAYREGADFADAMIAATNEEVGAERTVTLDERAAKRIPQLLLLKKT